MYIPTSKTIFNISVRSFCHFRVKFGNRPPSITYILNCQSGQTQGASFLPVYRAFYQFKGILLETEVRNRSKERRDIPSFELIKLAPRRVHFEATLSMKSLGFQKMA